MKKTLLTEARKRAIKYLLSVGYRKVDVAKIMQLHRSTITRA